MPGYGDRLEERTRTLSVWKNAHNCCEDGTTS